MLAVQALLRGNADGQHTTVVLRYTELRAGSGARDLGLTVETGSRDRDGDCLTSNRSAVYTTHVEPNGSFGDRSGQHSRGGRGRTAVRVGDNEVRRR